MRKLTLVKAGDPPGCRCGGKTFQVFITVPVSDIDTYLQGEIEIDAEAQRQLDKIATNLGNPHFEIIESVY